MLVHIFQSASDKNSAVLKLPNGEHFATLHLSSLRLLWESRHIADSRFIEDYWSAFCAELSPSVPLHLGLSISTNLVPLEGRK